MMQNARSSGITHARGQQRPKGALYSLIFWWTVALWRVSSKLVVPWSGVVQSVARQPLELDILVRVQAPEPLFPSIL